MVSLFADCSDVNASRDNVLLPSMDPAPRVPLASYLSLLLSSAYEQ